MRRDRKKRLRAVEMAAQGYVFKPSSRTDGLRAVLLFERINGVTADPDNLSHQLCFRGTGYRFALDRALKRKSPQA